MANDPDRPQCQPAANGAVAAPCPDCTPEARCDDHACDADLITGYQVKARALGAEIERTRPKARPPSSPGTC